MTTAARTLAGQRVRTIGGVGYDWVVTAAAAWLTGGLFLDGWAHYHIPGMETFFTPWHAVFYSGFAALALTLLAAPFLNHLQGLPWRQAIPAGYGPSLIGAGLFAFSGVADGFWHTLLGIEQALEALFSPPHLLLATGGVAMITGPLRAAWARRADRASWRELGPSIAALTILLAAIGFFTAYANPLVYAWAARGMTGSGRAFGEVSEMNLGVGVASILLQSAVMTGVILLALRRWQLPFGAITFMFTASAALITVLRDNFGLVIPVALAGLAADALLLLLKPRIDGSLRFRLFAFAVPAIYYLCYFIALRLDPGIGWKVHVWTGAIFLAGVVGLLVSFMNAPPLGVEKEA